jgi:hypothetical protein
MSSRERQELNLKKYKGPITRSKSRKPHNSKFEKHNIEEKKELPDMADRE